MSTVRTGERTLVCFAVPEEAAPFRRRLAASSALGVDVLVSGMGAANARRAFLDHLARLGAERIRVLTCGYAGGLDPALPRLAVVHDVDAGPNDGTAAALRERLVAAGSIPGSFHCATRVAVTASDKAGLWRSTGAAAVEMESGVIRDLCRQRGLVSATVRVISDAAGDDLPLDFNALMTPDMRLRFGRLALRILRSPGMIVRLLRFRKVTVEAANRLTDVLAAVVLRG